MSARESLAALLALHTLAYGNAEGWRCTCGHKGSREEYLSRAHVADAILAAGWTPPGPFPCCPHCAEDPVHDVQPNEHDLPCSTCERLERAAIIQDAQRGAAERALTDAYHRLMRAEEETGVPVADGTIQGAYSQGLRDAQTIVREVRIEAEEATR